MEWFKLQYLIDEMMSMVKPIWVKEWKIKIAPESMGKINVFGSIEEISRLAKETG